MTHHSTWPLHILAPRSRSVLLRAPAFHIVPGDGWDTQVSLLQTWATNHFLSAFNMWHTKRWKVNRELWNLYGEEKSKEGQGKEGQGKEGMSGGRGTCRMLKGDTLRTTCPMEKRDAPKLFVKQFFDCLIWETKCGWTGGLCWHIVMDKCWDRRPEYSLWSCWCGSSKYWGSNDVPLDICCSQLFLT